MRFSGRKKPLLWLGLGALFWAFSVGRLIIPFAAWLTPLFLLRFARQKKPLAGYVSVVLAVAAANLISWFGVATAIMPLPFYVVFILIYTAVFMLPYLLDRVISPSISGFASTMVFPLAWTAMEFLLSLVSPLGTWGSTAYTQYTNLTLVQMLAVTGLWGISFLIQWFAAVVNWSWEQHFDLKRTSSGILIFSTIFGLTLLAGGFRLLSAPEAKTVRVATLTRRDVVPAEIMQRLAQGKASALDITDYRKVSHSITNDLLARSRREAEAGAKIVFWAEASAFVLEEDEAELVAKGQELAESEQIFLGMELFTAEHREHREKPFQLKTVLVGPHGEVYPEYLKRHQVPGSNAATIMAGDGTIPIVPTPMGRIASTICYDLDFPRYIRQAGQEGLDIMFGPSSDWEGIKYQHGRQAMYRSIEYGFSLVRPANFGVSTANDSYGRLLASVDSFLARDAALVAQVPVRGTQTLYASAGDWFAWLSLAGLLVVSVWSRRTKR